MVLAHLEPELKLFEVDDLLSSIRGDNACSYGFVPNFLAKCFDWTSVLFYPPAAVLTMALILKREGQEGNFWCQQLLLMGVE